MTKEEALRLVDSAIKGQGNQVDIGNVLPQVLETALEGGAIDVGALYDGKPLTTTFAELGKSSLYYEARGKAFPVFLSVGDFNATLLRFDVVGSVADLINMRLYAQTIIESNNQIIAVGEETEYELLFKHNATLHVESINVDVTQKKDFIQALGIVDEDYDRMTSGFYDAIECGGVEYRLTQQKATGEAIIATYATNLNLTIQANSFKLKTN